MTAKERAIQAVQELPEDVDFQAVSEKLAFMRAVDEGLKQALEGKTVSAEEVRRRLAAA